LYQYIEQWSNRVRL